MLLKAKNSIPENPIRHIKDKPKRKIRDQWMQKVKEKGVPKKILPKGHVDEADGMIFTRKKAKIVRSIVKGLKLFLCR